MSRVFCTAFKRYLYPSRTTVTSAVGCGTSRQPKFASTFTISPSFSEPPVVFIHKPFKGTGHNSGCVAKLLSSIQGRHFSSSSGRQRKSRKANLLRLQQLLYTFTKMLGGRRRRSLRLSSQSRREPLSIINNVANANNGQRNYDENRPITVSCNP